MKATLEVQVTNDHLNKITKITPVKALSELIWNSLDADATVIRVQLDTNSLGGIERILLSDNGQGIWYGYVDDSFGKLGDSSKARTKQSVTGRKFHGKFGQGRYSAFTLGRNIKWVSVYEENGERKEFTITGDEENLRYFNISEEKVVLSEHGVRVIIDQTKHANVDKLGDEHLLSQEITKMFAPYLLAYPGITIYINDIIIAPEKIIKSDKSYLISDSTTEYGEISGEMRIIEWKTGSYKSLYLCSSDGVAYEEEKTSIRSNTFSHTAYLSSRIIDRLYHEKQLDIRDIDQEYNVLKDASISILRDIARGLLASEASEEIRKLKEQNIYPYDGEPKSIIELAERQVFDICAVKVNQLLPDFGKLKKDSKQFTYRLLKEALRSNPTSLTKILNEVLNLTSQQQDELAILLGKTSLSSIINTTALISNRLNFLNALEQILYGDEYHDKLKERSQLHKILLEELWIFGDQYQYGYDDISLKNSLKQHMHLLGRDDLLEEIDFRDIRGLNDIPDIGLYKQYVYGGGDYFENLIIELKRPNCIISQKEINQIERYAIAIEENEYFDKTKTKWKLLLLGVKMDNFTKKKVTQKDRAPGLIYSGDNIEVWVKEWSQVIQETKGKHQFLKERLEIEVKDNEEGMRYLREKYKKYLPD